MCVYVGVFARVCVCVVSFVPSFFDTPACQLVRVCEELAPSCAKDTCSLIHVLHKHINAHTHTHTHAHTHTSHNAQQHPKIGHTRDEHNHCRHQTRAYEISAPHLNTRAPTHGMRTTYQFVFEDLSVCVCE